MRHPIASIFLCALALSAPIGCAPVTAVPAGNQDPGSGTPNDPADPIDTSDDEDVETGSDTGEEAVEAEHPTVPPDLPAYSGGDCPDIIGAATNDGSINEDFLSSGTSRSFRLIVPDSYDGTTAVPLIFGWHWLNASASSFVRKSEMETAAGEMGVIAVFPDDIEGAYLFNWPFYESGDAVLEELQFTRDLLACIGTQYNIDTTQIHGIGVSAGGLWLAHLSGTDVVDHFASIMSLSGGLAEAYGYWQMEYTPRARKFPAFVLNGGPSDWLGVDFHAASERYVDELRDDSHFVVACEHDAGHDMPPIEPPSDEISKFYALWQFMLDHPYGLDVEASPYVTDGLPDFYPDWCWIVD